MTTTLETTASGAGLDRGRGQPPTTAGVSRPWLAALVLSLGGAYLLTLQRDISNVGDTTKFQYIGRILGTAHEPGYGLFTAMLAVFVRVFPFGEDAFRADLLSALLGVAACVLAFLVLSRLGVRPVIAYAGALLVGLSRTLWSQAVIVEVYTLYLLFAMAVLYLLMRWEQTRRDRDLVIALSVYALAFAHTPGVILFAPGIIAFVALVDWRAPFRWQVWGFLPLYALLAIGPYAYIVWRSNDPSTLFVEAKIRSFDEFVKVLRGETFQQYMFAFGPRTVLRRRIPMVLRLLGDQPLLWAPPFALIGLVRLRLRPVNVLLLGWCAVAGIWGLEYDIVDVFVYFILPFAVMALWTALGFDAIMDWVLPRLPQRVRAWHVAGVRPAAALAAGLVLLAPAGVFKANYRAADRSGDNTGEAVRVALAALPPSGAVVFTLNYHLFDYELLGKGRQPQLHVFAPYPMPLKQIDFYCQGGRPDMGGARDGPPPRLPIYAFGEPYLSWIAKAGYAMTPVPTDLPLPLVQLDCNGLPPK